ncbi:hypothetical protein TREMEDRAFT_71902 [Tremella mesenterica DSM 1558]|uniref:uncharacterized protein n=1 Tax=Tremella mesenterica (strain ATCC 24925 / CBS 8224 / DSM 1558 / NBRC 9311 / NRRL Y-6157 / RJB 2259-6 / UBC 559-6) TaxID=578456 RepID=UPI0003F490B5|nr:uncharacterized protein TREMEDRAFT_71902 [Tremella mesenterica DSM 1558]EIW68737.1 hypothetical protein TREMEDRAFT_71902 [Tremella mesenterica DSM 1558]
MPHTTRKEWLPHSQTRSTQNYLNAIVTLDPSLPRTIGKIKYNDDIERFVLVTNAQMAWIPKEDRVEIKIIVTFKIFMDMDKIYEPLPPAGQDLLGLILNSLLPSPTARLPTTEEKDRAVALRYFFASLRPAPQVSLTMAERIQAKELRSTLLPFQLRTVAKLLERENAPGFAVEKPSGDPPGFWSMVDFGESIGSLTYRRLTGELLPLEKKSSKARGKERERDLVMTGLQPPGTEALIDLSGIRGTMLCEEMGLGKTVEAISLIILNQHPSAIPRLDYSKSAIAGSSKEGSINPDDDIPVPLIDLSDGPPGLEDPSLKEWIQAQERAFKDKVTYDPEAQISIAEVPNTLIITPPSLLKQWVAEMKKHAPTLRVCVYGGWKSLQKGILKRQDEYRKRIEVKDKLKRKRESEATRNKIVTKYTKSRRGEKVKVEIEEQEDIKPGEQDLDEGAVLPLTQKGFIDYLRAHDIVITTYNDLQQDLTVAHPPPERSRRNNTVYKLNERWRSPLVMVEWWRVIMDEVQLCGNSTHAAEMVALIPRRNSLAMSGTPARTDIKDLIGSFRFLRVPIPPNSHIWHRLQQPSFRPAFEGLCRELAVRTTKIEVQNEFDIPLQKRMIVPIELSEIEVAYYNDTLERQRYALGLPLDHDSRMAVNWVLDRAKLRTALVNLRQICTHIQVGQLNGGRIDQRLHLGKGLMTMHEALERMRIDNSSEYNNQLRSQILERVRDRLSAQLVPIRKQLTQLLAERGSDDEDIDMSDRNISLADRERGMTMISVLQQIREMLIIIHQCWFFEGDIRHVQKEEEQEVAAYNQAETIRREVLSRPLQQSVSSISQLSQALKKSTVLSLTDLQTDTLTPRPRGGIETSTLTAQTTELLKILDGNAVLIVEWRKKIVELLSTPVESETTDVPGVGQGQNVENPEKEYYAEALNAQGEVEAYLIAYAAALADRREMMLEERSLLAERDVRTAKQRSTRAAIKAVAEAPEILNVPDEVQEQARALMAERQAFRDARKENDCEKPLKGLLLDLNSIIHNASREQEVHIAKDLTEIIKSYISTQTKHLEKLNKEIDLFRQTFNKRVIYFAALQEISDSVSAPEFTDPEKDLESINKEITTAEAALARLAVKGRYLEALGMEERNADELKEDCIVCMGSSDDDRAVLLACGHFFCNSCFKELRHSQHIGHRCPSCREPINERAITRIKLVGGYETTSKPSEVSKETKSLLPSASASGESALSAEEAERILQRDDMDKLRMMDHERMQEISHFDILGEYGSKINFLIKHLLYYRVKEPEARHVIFSNWSDSLNIVLQALNANRIKWVSFDQSSKTRDVVDLFIKDESISVFLLHAERESAGLTLTSCRVVHLLEPVLKHSFELQAIGRVDRLGQKHETAVYCYATMDTIETRILSQGVQNQTSIYLKDPNVTMSMPNVVSAAHKGGDVSDGNEEELLRLIL